MESLQRRLPALCCRPLINIGRLKELVLQYEVYETRELCATSARTLTSAAATAMAATG